ncbi:MAG: S8 family serine peptidase [Patescibacteria group bacterium]
MGNKKLLLLVAFVLNLVISPSVSAADSYYYKQWYLERINAPGAWTLSTGNANVVVAVIDTGVDINHPDLVQNIWFNSDEIIDGKDNDSNGFVDDVNGWDFISETADPKPKTMDDFSISAMSHGTFIAGLISAVHDNNQGIKGVTANVKIMPLLVMNAKGEGKAYNVARAIDYAVNNGAHIINLSFGGDDTSESLKNSIINAYNKGVLIVAASGNGAGNQQGVDMSQKPQYPVCYDQEFTVNRILGVSATNKDNKIASFANYGSGCIDISAPGVDIISLVNQDGSAFFSEYYGEGWQGSSFSAGLVSGATALLKSYDFSLTPQKMIETIKSSSGLLLLSDLKYKDKVGEGILNIRSALEKLTANSSLVTNQPVNVPVVPVKPVIITNEPKAGVKKLDQVYFSTVAKGNGNLRLFDKNLNLQSETIVLGEKFTSMDFAVADINNDSKLEIVAVGGVEDQGIVKIMDFEGRNINSWLPFGAEFKGGLSVAVGDTDNDGQVEIVIAPKSKYKPAVRIYEINGSLQREFLAYNKDFFGGVNVAIGDINGDKKNEIITAPNSSLMPKIKIFDGAALEIKNFLAYSVKFTGGVNIAVGDIDNDGVMDLLCGAGKTGAPHITAYRFDGTRLVSFFAYSENFTGGVSVLAGDWNNDGRTDILTMAGQGGGPHLRIFDFYGKVIKEGFLYKKDFRGGGVIH